LCTIEVKWGNAQWIIKRPYGQFQAFDAWTNHYVLRLSTSGAAKEVGRAQPLTLMLPVRLATCR
jgi:hypothetical protein